MVLWIGLDWNALFYVDKIVKIRKNMHKMHIASFNSYQSICLVKSTSKINDNNNINNNNNKDKIFK